MPQRAANKNGDASAKKGSRGKKTTATSPPEVVPSIVSEERKTSESEVEEKLLVPKVEPMEEVLSTADEDKVVAADEASLTAVVAEEDSKVIEEVVVEKSSEIVSEEVMASNGSNVDEERDNMQDKEEAGERDGGNKENGAVQMDADQDTRKESDAATGVKQKVVEEETTAADIEDTKGGGGVVDSKGDAEVDDTKGGDAVENNKRGGDGATNADVNGTLYEDEEEADKSGSDGEDYEDEEDPSVYMEAPLTERKKEKEFEIFVGGLDKEVVENDLIEIFREFGEILSARIVKHPTTQKSKGFAFIRYATLEQAKKVLVELKDGIEVRGKRVGISLSRDNDTLYLGNICKTWTKDKVLETLKSFGIEQIEIYLPDDPKTEGKSRGYALLEFSTHSDAMAGFQRLRKPDAVFGCDRSAKVAFAQSSIHPSEEALSQVKTVFIEGLTDSWDELKVKDHCKQYGDIEKVQLSRNLSKKRKDFCFVAFISRESAVACVEGINNAQIGEGDIKVKANLAKPQNKGRLAKQGARGSFKVKEDQKTKETRPPKTKGNAKSKRDGGKRKKTLPKSKNVKGGKSKPQGNLGGSQGGQVASTSERTNRSRNKQPHKGEKRGRGDMDTGYNGQSSKKARGIVHGGTPSNSSGSRRNKSRTGKPRPNYSAASSTYVNPYAQEYAASSSRYQGHMYGATSGSKHQRSDMEPHAGYLEPARKQSRDPYGFEPRRPVGYDFQGSRGAAFGGVATRSVIPPSYGRDYSSYAGYEGVGAGGGYVYPSSAVYPPRRAYY